MMLWEEDEIIKKMKMMYWYVGKTYMNTHVVLFMKCGS